MKKTLDNIGNPNELRIHELMKIAKSYVADLDRSRMGALGVDDGLLTGGFAHLILDSIISSAGANESLDELSKQLHNLNGKRDNRDDMFKATIEAVFWVGHHKDERLFAVASDVVTGAGFHNSRQTYLFRKAITTLGYERIDALSYAYQNPEYVPYILTGIDDYELIERCVVNSIDPEMARAIHEGASGSALQMIAN